MLHQSPVRGVVGDYFDKWIINHGINNNNY